MSLDKDIFLSLFAWNLLGSSCPFQYTRHVLLTATDSPGVPGLNYMQILIRMSIGADEWSKRYNQDFLCSTFVKANMFIKLWVSNPSSSPSSGKLFTVITSCPNSAAFGTNCNVKLKSLTQLPATAVWVKNNNNNNFVPDPPSLFKFSAPPSYTLLNAIALSLQIFWQQKQHTVYGITASFPECSTFHVKLLGKYFSSRKWTDVSFMMGKFHAISLKKHGFHSLNFALKLIKNRSIIYRSLKRGV